jgi:Tetratricopeptide repeat
MCLYTDGRYDELGQEHPDTLTSMNNLAFTWKGLGRNKEALELMEECVALRTRIIGTNHPYTLSSSTVFLGWQKDSRKLVPYEVILAALKLE